MSGPVSLVLERLRGVKAYETGYRALCPVHDDRKPSLSVNEGDDGRVIVYCHAGCSPEDVIDALGLRMSDLFPRPERDGRDFLRIVASYDYQDAEGRMLFQVVRFEPKGFRQRRPDGSGGWVWNLEGVEPVLYRLPEVLRAVERGETVHVVEGEKDADRLRSLGLVATTAPMGAGKWRDAYSETLRGTTAVILRDEDGAGRKHAERVAGSLWSEAASVKVAELPGLPNGGDVSDWLDAGGTAEELERLVREAPEWEPAPNLAPEPVGRLLDTVEPESVAWLWRNRVPLGKLTLIDGDPGTGKSALTADLAARVSVGGMFPDGSQCEEGGVVLLSAEDGLADTIRPRLEAAGADLSRVLALATVPDGDGERLLSLPEDLGIIRRGIERVQARLVVIDPLMAFLSGGVNSYRDQDVRRALAPLAKLAEETGAAIVVVRHLNKATGENPLYRGGGSIGIVGQARSALLVAKHPEDDRRRVLAHVKTNLSVPARSLAFAMSEAANGAVLVEWRGETSLDANALLAAPVDDGERRDLGTLRDAVVRLIEDSGGPWEGTATELHELLMVRDLAALPDRPDELTKRLKKIAATGEALSVSQGWRGKERVLRLRLHRAFEYVNGAGGVGGVGEPIAPTDATDTGRGTGNGAGQTFDDSAFALVSADT